jgi:hypothetical protein
MTVRLCPSGMGDRSISVEARANASLPGCIVLIKGTTRLAAPTPPKVIDANLIKSLLGLLFSDIVLLLI